MAKDTLQELAFWAAIALVSVCSSILFSLITARLAPNNKPLQQLAAVS